MSYAVIQTGGKQYKVSAGEIIKIEKLPDSNPDTKVEFKEILVSHLDDNLHLPDTTLFNYPTPDKLIEHANKICVNYNSCATSISQYAGLEAINGSQIEILKIVSEFQKRKEYVYDALNKLDKVSCFEPGGAFYAFPNISKSGLNGSEFSKIALEEKGVALVPGSSFGDNADHFVRISFANSLENIKEAIKRLSAI